MLKTKCNHHEILNVLGKSGHGNKVLIADGNYPIMTNTHEKTEKIYLGISPGLPNVPDVLKSILTVINIEQAEVMEPGRKEPEIFDEFRSITGIESLVSYERHEFYDLCREDSVTLVVNTGETRTFSNILLTIGVNP